MVLNRKLMLGLSILVFGILGTDLVNAAPLSQTYTGSLTSESGAAGSVVLESFTVSSPSDITIYTTSYGGGKNLDGTTASAGGFQPNLTLYNNTGFVAANQSPSFSPVGKTDTSTGLNLDGYLQDNNAAAGTYYVTLTDWNNMMSITSTGLNLSQAAYQQFTGAGGTSFQDVGGNTRNGNYDLNISVMPLNGSSVPEPATFLLVIPVLAALALSRRKRQAQVI